MGRYKIRIRKPGAFHYVDHSEWMSMNECLTLMRELRPLEGELQVLNQKNVVIATTEDLFEAKSPPVPRATVS